jgi:quinoprotein glucose dehydrogenase
LVILGEGGNTGVVVLNPIWGGAGGKSLRAYDKLTGAVVGEVALPGGTTAAPMTYMIDGQQFILVTLGWEDMPSEYVALALPRTE